MNVYSFSTRAGLPLNCGFSGSLQPLTGKPPGWKLYWTQSKWQPFTELFYSLFICYSQPQFYELCPCVNNFSVYFTNKKTKCGISDYSKGTFWLVPKRECLQLDWYTLPWQRFRSMTKNSGFPAPVFKGQVSKLLYSAHIFSEKYNTCQSNNEADAMSYLSSKYNVMNIFLKQLGLYV